MSLTADKAKHRALVAKQQAEASTAEPKWDCISNNFRGGCNNLGTLYCKIGPCSFYKTHDDLLDKKRTALAATRTAQQPTNTKVTRTV